MSVVFHQRKQMDNFNEKSTTKTIAQNLGPSDMSGLVC